LLSYSLLNCLSMVRCKMRYGAAPHHVQQSTQHSVPVQALENVSGPLCSHHILTGITRVLTTTWKQLENTGTRASSQRLPPFHRATRLTDDPGAHLHFQK